MRNTDGVLRGVSRRSYWREEDATVVVDAWRSSGDSLASFCRRRGLKPQRVARWAKRLQGGAVRFHPVRLAVGDRGGASDAARAGQALELELSDGHLLRLPAGFALEDLQRVLLALEARVRC